MSAATLSSAQTDMIDLTRLPAPEVIESLSYELIYAARAERYIALHAPADRGAVRAALSLESEPIVRLLQESAYTEMLLRQRINLAARATMLAYAAGADLDNLAALFGVQRAQGEDDDRLRTRTQLATEGYATAGPALAYIAHALSAHPAVRDVSVTSPAPGAVHVFVLGTPQTAPAAGQAAAQVSPTGVPSAALLSTVFAAVNADDVRPLTDFVSVLPAVVEDYSVRATLWLASGPDASTVVAAARTALAAYADDQFRLGRELTLSGIYAALHQPGVSRVDLAAPAANLPAVPSIARRCVSIEITVGEAQA